MKVKALVGFAGIGFSVAKGEVADLPKAIAEFVIKMGYAEAVESEAKSATKRTKK